jgi:HEAT repeat protein
MRYGTLLALCLFALFCLGVDGQPEDEKAKAELFRDEVNGYFMYLPPPGWRVQKYADPRTKVGFNHPEIPGVFIRFIVSEAPGETFDAMLQADKRTAQEMRARGISCDLKEKRVGGRRCCEIVAEFPNDKGATLLRKFITSGLHFNIQYAAPSRSVFDQYRDDALASLESVVVMKAPERDSEKARTQRVANHLRLAELTAEWVSPEEARAVLLEAQRQFPDRELIEKALRQIDEDRRASLDPECERLIQQLGSTSAAERRSAAMGLAQLGNKAAPAVGRLIESLKNDNDFQVRLWAATALGIIGDKSAVEPLISALKDEGGIVNERGTLRGFDKEVNQRTSVHYVRQWAAWALGELADSRATTALIGVLDDEDPEVVKHGLWALRKIGDARGVTVVVEHIEHPDETIANAAYEAMKDLSGQDLGRDCTAWMNWVKENLTATKDN